MKHLFADGAYDRLKLMDKAAYLDFVIEIIRRSDEQKGFQVLPRRWVVNRRTMLPVWDLNGLHSLNVRAVGARILLRGSSSERVNLSHANQSRHKS